ncbi:MAG: hypothetical protein WDW36_005066 [Sanguina aurantia]
MSGKAEEAPHSAVAAGGESDQGGQHVSHLVAEAALGLGGLDINDGQQRQQYRRNAPRNEDGTYVNPEDAPRRGRGGRGRRTNAAPGEEGAEGVAQVEGEEGAPRQRRPRRQEIDPAELVVPCPQCERRFRNEQGLQRHTLALHGLQEGDEGYVPRAPRNPRRNNNRRRIPAPAVEGEAAAEGEGGAPVEGGERRPRKPRRNRGGRVRNAAAAGEEGGAAIEGGNGEVGEDGQNFARPRFLVPGASRSRLCAPQGPPRRRGGRGGGGGGGEIVEGGRGRGGGGGGGAAPVEGGEAYYADTNTEYAAPQ